MRIGEIILCEMRFGQLMFVEMKFWRFDTWPNKIRQNEPHPFFMLYLLSLI